MTPELATQIAIRGRLISRAEVTDLVPASAILDHNGAPAPRPSIVLGDVQTVDPGGSIKRELIRVYHDLHVWRRDPSTEQTQLTLHAIRVALCAPRLSLSEGFFASDVDVMRGRILKDPDGETIHGILTVNILVHVKPGLVSA